MKRIMFFICVMLLMSACTQLGMTPDQDMVKQSVEPSLVVVCSQYGMPNRTGNGSRVEYGYSYSLGVFTDTGFVAPASTLGDYDGSQYGLSSDAYFCRISYRRIANNLYRPLPPCADIVSSNLLHFPAYPPNYGPSLAEYTDTVFDNSWLLWAYVSDTLGEAGTFYTMATELSVDLDDMDLTQRVVAPTLPEALDDCVRVCKAIGAVWVVPCSSQRETPQYHVAGMVVRDSDGWVLVPLFLDEI